MKGVEVKKKLQRSGFSLKSVADVMGETPQNLNSMLSAQDVKTGVLERIAEATNLPLSFFYSEKLGLMSDEEIAAQDAEVSAGTTQVGSEPLPKAVRSQRPQKKIQEQGSDVKASEGVPLIPIDAVAGYGEDNAAIKYEDCEIYRVPEFQRSGVEFIIRVSGSSMSPKYSNGDVLACKKITDILFFQWGKVYVIDSSQGQLVKRVFEHENPEMILLVSDNKEKYPPFAIPKSDIRSLSIVLGVIRME